MKNPMYNKELLRMIVIDSAEAELAKLISTYSDEELNSKLEDNKADSSVNGLNLLQFICKFGGVNSFKLVYTRENVNRNPIDQDGNTLVHLATSQKNSVILNILGNLKYDFNVPNNFGDTPLHIGIITNQIVVALLLGNGAKFDVRNKRGVSPLDNYVKFKAQQSKGQLLTFGIDNTLQENGVIKSKEPKIDKLEENFNNAMTQLERAGQIFQGMRQQISDYSHNVSNNKKLIKVLSNEKGINLVVSNNQDNKQHIIPTPASNKQNSEEINKICDKMIEEFLEFETKQKSNINVQRLKKENSNPNVSAGKQEAVSVKPQIIEKRSTHYSKKSESARQSIMSEYTLNQTTSNLHSKL